MEELGQLERHDRQRRQEAVAKIPVRVLLSSSQLKVSFLRHPVLSMFSLWTPL